MSDSFAIEPYCRRIGYTGGLAADLDTLAELHRLHPAAIAFENLATLTGHPVSLDIDEIQDKLVGRRRGGYCFEQNGLFAAALEALGFEVERFAARVVMGREAATAPPRTHMLMLAHVRGRRWLCDVGFGGLSLVSPLMLEPGLEQRGGDVVYRIRETGLELELQARLTDVWKPLYRFDLQAQQAVDFEMMNHFVQTHPSSRFRNELIAARPTVEARHALCNDEYTIRWTSGASERHRLGSVTELHRLLASRFGIDVELDADLEAALARCMDVRAA